MEIVSTAYLDTGAESDADRDRHHGFAARVTAMTGLFRASIMTIRTSFRFMLLGAKTGCCFESPGGVAAPVDAIAEYGCRRRRRTAS